jgi:multidrug efflux pump subunit AcrB
MFFASGDSASFQPLAISIGFGLAWGTILNLIYLPIIYIVFNRYKFDN